MRLRTIGLISILVLGLLAGPLPVEAQQAGKVYRIGWLGIGGPGSQRRNKLKPSPQLIAFRQRLGELGSVEGQNLVIEHRCADRKRERRREIAVEVARLNVGVIVIPGAPSMIRVTQRATSTIPIVVAGFRYDPVKAGYVMSLARPGGNITGLNSLESKLYPKRLQLLKETFPRLSRVVILWYQYSQRRWGKELKAVAQALGIQIQTVGVQRGGLFDLESVFSAILHADRAQPQESPRGLLVGATGLTLTPSRRARVIEVTAKRRLPTMYYRNHFVNEGGLMSYSADSQHMWRKTATYVDKILKGAKPGVLPIEQPTKFDFVINLKTAKQLGVTIPPKVLYQATKVIK